MSVQAVANVTNHPFILNGESKVKESETVAQDALRVSDLLRHTLMAYNPTTLLWEPWTDETATDGTQFPIGIIMATVETAALVAGNVPNIPILVGDAVVDENQLVIENSLTLATVINVPAGLNTNAEDSLRSKNIYTADTVAIEEFENPATT